MEREKRDKYNPNSNWKRNLLNELKWDDVRFKVLFGMKRNNIKDIPIVCK